MKVLAALAAVLLMCGCCAPARSEADGVAHLPSNRIVICIFASCKFNQPETPPPASSSTSGNNTLNPQASRLDTQHVEAGERP